MRNFNTNQTRHFYTDKIAVNGVTTSVEVESVKPEATADAVALFFKGTNADGLPYRSDLVPIDKIVSLKKTPASAMATPLMKHTITINTDEFADVAALAGKLLKLSITVHQVFDYDDSNSITFTVEHKVAATETAANFYKALADAVKAAMPTPDSQYPYFTVESSATGLVLTEAPQKYVRGKLTGEPVHFSVSFGIAQASYLDDADVAWGVDTVEKSDKTVPANYVLADLEYFAFGERGDYFRGNNWPNNVEPTYAINPKSTDAYSVLTVEYYWAGNAENVQKSPRLIQVAAVDVDAMYNKIVALLPPTNASVAKAIADAKLGA